MDFREQIRQMERVNINDMDRVPEWARVEQLERIVPLKELWRYLLCRFDGAGELRKKMMRTKDTAVFDYCVAAVFDTLRLTDER